MTTVFFILVLPIAVVITFVRTKNYYRGDLLKPDDFFVPGTMYKLVRIYSNADGPERILTFAKSHKDDFLHPLWKYAVVWRGPEDIIFELPPSVGTVYQAENDSPLSGSEAVRLRIPDTYASKKPTSS